MAHTPDCIPQTAIPISQADALDWLRLIRSDRVGPVTFLRLLRQFGTAGKALAALPDIATNAGVSKYRQTSVETVRDEVRRAKALGARLIFLGTKDYPNQLLDLPDPPPALWALGNPELLKRPMVALVGARNASAVGKRMTTKLAHDLGEMGYVVVSGLARGIDKAAHEASLDTGTVAVQAGGIDVIYPTENAELTLKVAEHGLRLSEMPIGLPPQAKHFPRRNRIISGLAQAVVVVEGAARSGSLITAKNALDQGREVMAVPGSPLDPRASGCNLLIREGALLVRDADDIHDAISGHHHRNVAEQTANPPSSDNTLAPTAQTQPASNLPDSILNLLSPVPITEDELIRKLGVPATQIMSMLAELDVTGQIDRQPGGLVARSVA